MLEENTMRRCQLYYEVILPSVVRSAKVAHIKPDEILVEAFIVRYWTKTFTNVFILKEILKSNNQ